MAAALGGGPPGGMNIETKGDLLKIATDRGIQVMHEMDPKKAIAVVPFPFRDPDGLIARLEKEGVEVIQAGPNAVSVVAQEHASGPAAEVAASVVNFVATYGAAAAGAGKQFLAGAYDSIKKNTIG